MKSLRAECTEIENEHGEKKRDYDRVMLQIDKCVQFSNL